MIVKGRVFKFGDNINTTYMWPIERVTGDEARSADGMKPHVLETIRPGFYKEIKKGDVIVAGGNWGGGSHRMGATTIMADMGISCIVADSIARIYYRNCISVGLPAIPCEGVSEIFNDGDQIEVDVEKAEIKNLTTGKIAKGSPMPGTMMDIFKAGGIIPILVEKLKKMDEQSGTL
jgi:3-isopropylmalate dehydratase small subunit